MVQAMRGVSTIGIVAIGLAGYDITCGNGMGRGK